MAITDPLDRPRYRPTIPIDRPHAHRGTLTLVDANKQIMHVFWQTHYHLVWVTKNRSPLITPQDETFLYPYIKGKADTIGCIIHAIGGIHDHIHLIISIPLALAVADVVKRLTSNGLKAAVPTPSTIVPIENQTGLAGNTIKPKPSSPSSNPPAPPQPTRKGLSYEPGNSQFRVVYAIDDDSSQAIGSSDAEVLQLLEPL